MILIDAGEIDGVRYVDVLTDEWDPVEYGITLADARARYGRLPVRRTTDY